MKKIIFLLLLTTSLLLATSTIQSSGYGKTENEALKSAFQNAVEQYVGVLIDSKTIMNNGKLIEDKILTFSNGYIDRYKKLSSIEQMGLWEVKIEALIKQQEVLSEIKKLKINPIDIEGREQRYAKLISQVKSKFDAEDMIVSLVKEYGEPHLYKYLDMKIDNIHIFEDEATRKYVPIEIRYSIYFNWEQYDNIVKKFQKLFKGIGGKVIRSVPFTSTGNDRQIGIRSARDLATTSFIIITRTKNHGLISEVWEFPKPYKVIYPFQKGATCSTYNQDDKKIKIFKTKEVLNEVLKPRISFRDENKNNLLPPEYLKFYLNSEEFNIFSELQWSEISARCFGSGKGSIKVLSPPRIHENIQSGGKRIPNKTMPLYRKMHKIKFKVSDIKKLKQIFIDINNE